MSDPFGEDEVDFDIEAMLTGAYTSALACLRDTRAPLGSRMQHGLRNPIDGVEADVLTGSRPSSPLPAWATPQAWGKGLQSFADLADGAIDSVASPMAKSVGDLGNQVGNQVGGIIGEEAKSPSTPPPPTRLPTAAAAAATGHNGQATAEHHQQRQHADSSPRKTIYSLPPGMATPTAQKVDRSSREACTPRPVADLGKGLSDAGRGVLSLGEAALFGQAEAKARPGKAGADMV